MNVSVFRRENNALARWDVDLPEPITSSEVEAVRQEVMSMFTVKQLKESPTLVRLDFDNVKVA